MRDLRRRIGRHLSEPGEKRRYVRDLFAGIAGRYDLTNDVMSLGMHRRWKRLLMDLADPSDGDRVLDLATGTGDLALRAVERVEADGLVVGLDLTREMLEEARLRTGAGMVEWIQGDGLALPFDDATFDHVVVGYGLRNLADLETGIREIRRVLRGGGGVVSLDFGKPRSRLLRQLYLRYLEISTAAAGWLLHRDPEAYVYIPESLSRFPDQPAQAALFREAGFERCGFVELMFGTMAIHFARKPAG